MKSEMKCQHPLPQRTSSGLREGDQDSVLFIQSFKCTQAVTKCFTSDLEKKQKVGGFTIKYYRKLKR